jgi:hypothetical protein
MQIARIQTKHKDAYMTLHTLYYINNLATAVVAQTSTAYHQTATC